MEDSVEEWCVKVDEKYEFEAPQFFDFTKPELDSQIEEVERWFQICGEDPHSPAFVVKLDLDQIMPDEDLGCSSPKLSKSRKSNINSDIGLRHGVPTSKKIGKAASSSGKGHLEEAGKQPKQSRSSKFMEPTASHLAKQHDKPHQLSSQSSKRLPRARDKTERTEFQEFHFKTSERASHHPPAKAISRMPTPIGSPLANDFNKRTTLSERRSSTNSRGSSSSRSSRGSIRSEYWR